MTKRCRSCEQSKSVSAFRRDGSYVFPDCKHCTRIKMMARRLARNQKLVRDVKDKPCADCRKRYPYYVMDFDHVNDEKRFNIGTNTPTRSIKQLLAEIGKCDVVCANCHRQREHRRRNAKRR